MTFVPESLNSHYIRWAKLEYDSIPELGIDVSIMMYEQEKIDFESLQTDISAIDSNWQESWETYRRYNKL